MNSTTQDRTDREDGEGIAARLRRLAPEILSRWRRQVAAGGGDPVSDLDASGFLAELAARLEDRAADPPAAGAGSGLRLLRGCVLEGLEADGPLPPRKRERLVEAIDELAFAGLGRLISAASARETAVLEQMVEGVAFTDAAGRLIRYNAAARRMLGREPDPSLAPEDWPAVCGLFAPDGRMLAVGELPLVRALAGERVTGQEMLIRRPDGVQLSVSVSAMPVPGADGRPAGVVAVFRDLTAERRQLDELVRRRRLADEAGRRQSRIFSALSHDIRTPLNSIVLLTQSLKLTLAEAVPADDVAELASINECVQSIVELLRDLLELARLDGGTLKPEPGRFEAGAAARQAVAEIADSAAARGLSVSVDAPAPLILHTDRERLLQILGHLLTNAVKYTLAGSVTVRVRFDGPYPTFRVEDTGIGVPADQREAIFEEFFRVGRTHRPMGEGRGLGLAISRRVARLLGGELFAEDRPGGGSAFVLRLPPEVVAGAEEPSAAGM